MSRLNTIAIDMGHNVNYDTGAVGIRSEDELNKLVGEALISKLRAVGINVGKLNFYLSAVDDILKTEQDNPTIGLLLCREKNKLIAEYALKDMTKPIGVSEYTLFEELPKEFEDTLPTIEDLESRINCFDS